MVLVVPFWIACAVLALAGSAKVGDPRFTAGALVDLGVPMKLATWNAVRVIGIVEVVLAVAALVSGWWVGALIVSVAYLAFAAVVLAALRSDSPLQTCGCFGIPDVAPTPGHVVLNLAFSAVATGAVFADTPSASAVIREAPGSAAVLIGMTALGAWLGMAAFKEMGVLVGMRRRKAAPA